MIKKKKKEKEQTRCCSICWLNLAAYCVIIQFSKYHLSKKIFKRYFKKSIRIKQHANLSPQEKDTSIASIMVKYIYSMLNLVVLCFLGIWKSNNVTNSQLVQVTLYPHKKGKSIHSLHFLAHKTIYHRGKVERSGYHYASMF